MVVKAAVLGLSLRGRAKAVTRATLLWVLLTLFVLRVLGQLLVVSGAAAFLPPMEEWHSGLLPYPLLLASQVVIIAALATVCLQFSRGRGLFVRPQAWLATPLWIVGWIYAIGMVVRYAMLRRDLIPVTFHIVLAAFLLVVARHQRTQKRFTLTF
jgi:uncharacterized protein